MREIAYTHVRYGCRRVDVLLRREGRQLGRAYRMYCEKRLQLRSKLLKRRKTVVTRMAKIVPVRPNDAWNTHSAMNSDTGVGTDSGEKLGSSANDSNDIVLDIPVSERSESTQGGQTANETL